DAQLLIAGEELEKLPAFDLEQLAVPHRLHRGRAPGPGEDGEVSDRRTRSEQARDPRLAIALDDDAQSSRDDEEETVGGIVLVEQPLLCRHPNRLGRCEQLLLDARGQRTEERSPTERDALAHRPILAPCAPDVTCATEVVG